MDFGTLKADILAVIGREPADVCYRLVTADINQDMRLRVMEAETTLTAALEMTLPTDFLSVVSVYVDVTPRRTLRQFQPQALQRMINDGTGTPKDYAIVDGKMLLGSIDGAADIKLRYIAKVSDLSADSDTNDVLTTHPAIYVYGVLAHHAALTRDESAVPIYAAAYQAEMKKARASDTKKGGPPPEVVPRAVA